MVIIVVTCNRARQKMLTDTRLKPSAKASTVQPLHRGHSRDARLPQQAVDKQQVAWPSEKKKATWREATRRLMTNQHVCLHTEQAKISARHQ